jgi:hypothetical protein
MIIKTKKYALPRSVYIKEGFFNAIRKQWWVLALFAVAIPVLFYSGHWGWGIFAIVLCIIFLFFRAGQFYAVTKMEQSRFFFEPLRYQISSKEIMIQLTTKRGSPISWKQVKSVKVNKKRFLLFLGPAQFLYFPRSIFYTKQEIKFMMLLLRRKKFIK